MFVSKRKKGQEKEFFTCKNHREICVKTRNSGEFRFNQNITFSLYFEQMEQMSCDEEAMAKPCIRINSVPDVGQLVQPT